MNSSPRHKPVPRAARKAPVSRGRRWLWLIPLLLLLGAAATGILYLQEPAASSSPRILHFPRAHLSARVEAWRSAPSRILAADGSALAELDFQRCDPVGIDSIPITLGRTFEVAESGNPCAHPGTLEPLLSALGYDTLEYRADQARTLEVCSVLRRVLFDPSHAQSEPWIALPDGTWLSLEDPEPLLMAYMNLVDLGEGVFGVSAGARYWFDKPTFQLDIAQAAYLAARAAHPELREDTRALRGARDEILKALVARGFLLPSTERLARFRELPRGPEKGDALGASSEYLERTTAQVNARLSQHPALRGGVTVRTPLDPELQAVAEQSIERISKLWQKNRKKEVRDVEALIESLEPIDGVTPEPELLPGTWLEVPDKDTFPSFGLTAIEPVTGRVRLLYDACEKCSGRDNGLFKRRRQPGSAWKPFVYATAVEQGLTQVMSFPDAPFRYEVRNQSWSPKNHEEHYYGQVQARRALAQSLNSVAIQLILRLGPQKVAELAQRLGIGSRIVPVPAMALGTPPVTLMELTRAYATFPSGGQRVTLTYVDSVEDARGRPLPWPAPQPGAQVLDPRVAYVMVNMLQEVATSGTASAARRLGFQVGGKTGTTNESKDAWFVGFSSRLVAGVWVGFANKDPLGGHETGGSLALPVWMDLMKRDAKDDPPGAFVVPPGIVLETRSPWTGQPWAEGPQVAFIGKGSKPCGEWPPIGGTLVAPADGKSTRYLRTFNPRPRSTGYKCDWNPVQP